MKDVFSHRAFLGKRFTYNTEFKNPAMSSAAIASQNTLKTKVEKGNYKYETCSCYCGSEDSILLADMDAYGNYYPFVICTRCGIMRANPRFTKKAYIDFYTHEYRSLYGDKDRDINELFAMGMKQAQEIYSFITEHVNLPAKAIVFDIGCDMGTLLSLFHDNGFEVAGVDYGPEHIEYGRKRTGLNLETGGVEKLQDFDVKADLIILNQVFEHFLDIDEEIKKIGMIMKPDAYLYISVPGTFWWIENVCRSNIMGLLQNAHTWQFTLNTLRYVMECNGFELIYGNEKILSIFRINDEIKRNHNDVSPGESEKIIKYLKRVEKRYFPRHLAIKTIEFLGLKNDIKKLVGSRKQNVF